MISYELAKELKEAGFPQGWRTFYFDPLKQGPFYGAVSRTENFTDVWIACPTLSELIEACGLDTEDEQSVGFYRLDWDCYTKNFEAFAGTASNHFEGRGTTPDEAVARLWLALNKK